MPPSNRALLPASADLALLSDYQAGQVCHLVDREGERSNRYAMFGMLCGTVSFLGSLDAFVYLVQAGHYTAAGVVLGTTVLGIIGKMITSRL